jgi:hypothetical protein
VLVQNCFESLRDGTRLPRLLRFSSSAAHSGEVERCRRGTGRPCGPGRVRIFCCYPWINLCKIAGQKPPATRNAVCLAQELRIGIVLMCNKQGCISGRSQNQAIFCGSQGICCWVDFCLLMMRGDPNRLSGSLNILIDLISCVLECFNNQAMHLHRRVGHVADLLGF